MPKFDFYPSFNAGEVSPLIDARTSLEKYRSACRTLENFQILPYGGVLRRPGTQYLGTTKSGTTQTRLVGFNFSTTTRFVLEMGVGYMRFWKPDGTLVTAASSLASAWASGNYYIAGNYVTNSGTTYYCTTTHTSATFSTDLSAGRWTAQSVMEVPTPYTASVLQEIQYTQVNDIVYFAHASHPPYKLSRLADNNWTFEKVDFEFPPQLNENTDATTISVNREQGNVTLTASSPIFDSGHVGTRWDLKWKRFGSSFDFAIGGKWASASMDVENDWDFSTFGTWNAVIRIMRTPYEIWKNGPIQCKVTRTTTVCTVSHTNHGYSVGDIVQFISGPAPFYSATPYTILATDFTQNSYQVTVANSGATSGTVVVENISQMEVVREYDSNGDRNIITSGNESKRCGLKIWISTYTSATNARALLTNNYYFTGGIVKINSVAADGLTASASVLEWLGADSRDGKKTTFWTEPAFNDTKGYPRSVTLHQQRLCFGGTGKSPTTIWASEIDNFENFKIGTTASDAFQFTLAASEGNRITWMYSQQNSMLVGTTGDEWVVSSADTSSSLSSTNIDAKRQSAYGSKYMRATLVNDVLLFVQRNGRKVRELVYELNKDGWVAPDLTLLAEHITAGEITEIAYQQQPDAVLWCVRGDGALIAMTYERDQKVVGWHRHLIGDAQVESVSTIYGNGTEDEVWMVVKRFVGIVAGQKITFSNLPFQTLANQTFVVLTSSGNTFTIGTLTGESIGLGNDSVTPGVSSVSVVGGSFTATITSLSSGVFTHNGIASATHRTIERFPLLWRSKFDELSTADYRFLDSHAAFSSGAANRSITGLSRLDGKTVTVVQGESVVTRTVSGGAITVPAAAAGYLGLPYTSTLTPMKLDAEYEDGTSQGRKKRIHQIVVRTLKSRGGQVRTNNGDWYNLASTTTTGDQKMILAGAFGLDADVSLRQTDPYPMCVLAITPKWDSYGNE